MQDSALTQSVWISRWWQPISRRRVPRVFTTNVFCSAPVTVSKEHLDGAGYGIARAVAINSGIANAATGDKGLQTARQSSGIVADALGCPVQEVLVASTGVIGQHLQMEPFESGAPLAASALSAAGGADAARAIMTTTPSRRNSP